MICRIRQTFPVKLSRYMVGYKITIGKTLNLIYKLFEYYFTVHGYSKTVFQLVIRMCPQWSAVVGTDHHSDKTATITNSLISTKISTPMKMLSPNRQLLYVTHTYVHT